MKTCLSTLATLLADAALCGSHTLSLYDALQDPNRHHTLPAVITDSHAALDALADRIKHLDPEVAAALQLGLRSTRELQPPIDYIREEAEA